MRNVCQRFCLLFLVLGSSLVSAEPLVEPIRNPFASAGDTGVGDGWEARPARFAGNHVRLEYGELRIDATEEGNRRPMACQSDFTPVETLLWIQGEARVEGISAERNWHGGNVVVRYYDENRQALSGEDLEDEAYTAKDTSDWASVAQVFRAPERASYAKICAVIKRATTGSMWVRGLGFRPLEDRGGDNQKNVLFIVLDTFRADVLGTHGNSQGLTPNIDRFSSQSLSYARAWTQYTWTVPSYVSYMTSRYVRSHGWRYSMNRTLEEGLTLSTAVPTLPEVLREYGYVTIGYTNNGYLKKQMGMDRGFDIWILGQGDRGAVEQARRDIEGWSVDGVPNFLYVHLMTTHLPICPSEEAQRATGDLIPTSYVIDPTVMCPEGGVYYHKDYENITEGEHLEVFRRAYMAGVREADILVGRLLESLEANGHADDTVVVLTSDHGELLREHDNHLGHGEYVFEELTWVPLMIRSPELESHWVDDRVGELIDIAPTVLDLVGLYGVRPSSWQGGLMHRSGPVDLSVSEREHMVAYILDGRFKFVEDRRDNSLLMSFDLEQDSGEHNSLHANPPAEVLDLRQAAVEWREIFAEGTNEGEELVLDEQEHAEALEALQALGYVE